MNGEGVYASVMDAINRSRKREGKRPLRDEDVLGFYEARASMKEPLTREQVLAHLEKKNAYRMWRIRHDYRWLRRQLKKLGMNPDNARELL